MQKASKSLLQLVNILFADGSEPQPDAEVENNEEGVDENDKREHDEMGELKKKKRRRKDKRSKADRKKKKMDAE